MLWTQYLRSSFSALSFSGRTGVSKFGKELEPAVGTIVTVGACDRGDGVVFSLWLYSLWAKSVNIWSKQNSPFNGITGKSLEPVTRLWYSLNIDLHKESVFDLLNLNLLCIRFLTFPKVCWIIWRICSRLRRWAKWKEKENKWKTLAMKWSDYLKPWLKCGDSFAVMTLKQFQTNSVTFWHLV